MMVQRFCDTQNVFAPKTIAETAFASFVIDDAICYGVDLEDYFTIITSCSIFTMFMRFNK